HKHRALRLEGTFEHAVLTDGDVLIPGAQQSHRHIAAARLNIVLPHARLIGRSRCLDCFAECHVSSPVRVCPVCRAGIIRPATRQDCAYVAVKSFPKTGDKSGPARTARRAAPIWREATETERASCSLGGFHQFAMTLVDRIFEGFGAGSMVLVQPTDISGVLVILPKRHGDRRGYFSE